MYIRTLGLRWKRGNELHKSGAGKEKTKYLQDVKAVRGMGQSEKLRK